MGDRVRHIIKYFYILSANAVYTPSQQSETEEMRKLDELKERHDRGKYKGEIEEN